MFWLDLFGGLALARRTKCLTVKFLRDLFPSGGLEGRARMGGESGRALAQRERSGRSGALA